MKAVGQVLFKQIPGLAFDRIEVQGPVRMERGIGGGDQATQVLLVLSVHKSSAGIAVARLWAQQKHEHRRDQRRNCTAGKAGGQRDATVLESAKQRGEAGPGSNAYEIHHAVTGGSETRWSDLAQDGHVVGVKHAKAQSVQHSAGYHQRKTRGKPYASERRHGQQKAEPTDISAAADATLGPVIG